MYDLLNKIHNSYMVTSLHLLEEENNSNIRSPLSVPLFVHTVYHY